MDKKRLNIRYAPDDNTLVRVTFKNNEELIGLAFSESYKGCGGIFLFSDRFKEEDIIKIEVGNLDEQSAKVKWIKKISSAAMEVGFNFLD